MKKRIILSLLSLIAVVSFTACAETDVIGTQSVKSFDAVLNTAGNLVNEDANFGGWSLQAPDGAVKFFWSQDFSKTTTKDVMLELNAQPFINAGLDATKLPEGMLVGDKIVVGTDLGKDELNYSGDATALKSYEQIVKLYRDNITYHVALDHYGVALTNGNMFEWAKDMTKNDKDIVFVLNPQPFIDAGVDVANVEGWVFAKVPTMDANGNKIEVDKLLKPFDLDGKK